MRFCDFFLEYKIGIKDVKNYSSWHKLPLYRKVLILLILIYLALIISLLYFEENSHLFISLIFFAVIYIIFSFLDSTKKNLRKMLDNHYIVHSQSHMAVLVNAFKKYELDIYNSYTIDMLIEQAESEKNKHNSFSLTIKKQFSFFIKALAFVITCVASKIADVATISELLFFVMFWIMFSFYFFILAITIGPLIRDALNKDAAVYDDLIYDLNQLKIFYKPSKIIL